MKNKLTIFSWVFFFFTAIFFFWWYIWDLSTCIDILLKIKQGEPFHYTFYVLVDILSIGYLNNVLKTIDPNASLWSRIQFLIWPFKRIKERPIAYTFIWYLWAYFLFALIRDAVFPKVQWPDWFIYIYILSDIGVWMTVLWNEAEKLPKILPKILSVKTEK